MNRHERSKNSMKRISAIAAAFAVSLAAVPFSVFAVSADSCDVYVTISNGEHKIVMEKVTVTDIDSDGALTINDALYNAHESFYDGGAEAGYATEKTKWGLSLTKLWGVVNGGSYGYYVNNSMAWSLTDAVADGDHISAYVYTDARNYTDTYTFFDANTLDVASGSDFDVTLKMMVFNSDGNAVAVPLEGAVITIDGEATDITTDANGKATIPTSAAGTFLISATSSTTLIVPPALMLNVTGGSDDSSSVDSSIPSGENETDIIPIEEDSSASDSQTDSKNDDSSKKSDSKSDSAASSSSDKTAGASKTTTTTGGTGAAAAASGADAEAAATGSSSLAFMIAGVASLAAAAIAANKKKNG